jgi:DNA-directed RNA polymerase subunit RPC12/RpoP
MIKIKIILILKTLILWPPVIILKCIIHLIEFFLFMIMKIKFKCKECGRNYSVDSKYAGQTAKCEKCGSRTVIPVKAQKSLLDKIHKIKKVYVNCRRCGFKMQKKKKTETKTGLKWLGVVIFFIGLILLFLFPIGTVVGIFLMAGTSRLGYNKKKIWLCPNCGYFFQRTK